MNKKLVRTARNMMEIANDLDDIGMFSLASVVERNATRILSAQVPQKSVDINDTGILPVTPDQADEMDQREQDRKEQAEEMLETQEDAVNDAEEGLQEDTTVRTLKDIAK
jgi:hypothetical protein